MGGSTYVTEEVIVSVAEYSDTVVVISNARTLAQRIGFSETTQYLVATAASELATNIVKYAGHGRVILRMLHDEHRSGIEVVAQDAGPGISDIGQAMKDHFSTGHSLGLGLSSVKRIMDEFSVDSSPGKGTQVSARKWK